MAYFNNAATTYPKPECVYKQMDAFYRLHGGHSIGRGEFNDVLPTSILVKETRDKIKHLLHCPAKEVVFTPSATISLNIIIQGLINRGRIKNVYITPFEHNSVTRILHHYEKQSKVCVEVLSVDKDLNFQIEKIKQQFEIKDPDLVILSHASNVIGLVCPVHEIASQAKRYGALTVIDMAQTAGLIDLNVGSEAIDFAVFAGHKTLYGPTGISGFVLNPSISLEPIIFGGTGFDSANQDMPSQIPERYEVATSNISGLAGLHAALTWIEETGVSSIKEIEIKHRQRLIELLSNFDYLKLIGCSSNEHIGIISVLMPGISSDSAGMIFSERNIAVRSGLQCAPMAHKFLGTYPAGTIRFSTSYFTTEEDFCELENVLTDIQLIV